MLTLRLENIVGLFGWPKRMRISILALSVDSHPGDGSAFFMNISLGNRYLPYLSQIKQ